MRTVGRSRWSTLMLCAALFAALGMLPPIAGAVDLPPAGAQNFVQTSGPQTPLTIGDYYTSAQGGNDPTGHEFRVFVPCQWNTNLPITFAIFDPEVAVPDPATTDPIQADDEIRNSQNQEVDSNNSASNTSFTLIAPGGANVSKTYTPTGGTNRLWVELQTIKLDVAGYGCGTYVLRAVTGGNDDNAYVIRVGNVSGCTVTPGSCSTVSAATSQTIGDQPADSNPDKKNGTGDEIVIGMQRTSFQQYPLAPGADPNTLACQNFYTFVNPAIGSVTFNNFDLDQKVNGKKTVDYYPPGATDATKKTGTVSGDQRWNGDPAPGVDANGVPVRKGDSYAIDDNNAGWWRIKVCTEPANPPTSAKNQYIVESSAGVLFLEQPPMPEMSLTKTDGVNEATRGQLLTYVMTFANTSTGPTAGAAYNVTLSDKLPIGTTYQSCAVDAPYTGTCSFANGSVSYSLNEIVPSGATGSVRVTVKVNNDAPARLENLAQVDYGDNLGNRYPPKRAVDVDTVPAPVPPNAVTLANFTATRGDGTIALRWTTTSEIDSTGFYILRSAGSPETATRISPLIRAVGANGGASYSWTDADPSYGATYWLEEVDSSGTITRYGPVKAAAAVTANYSVLVPLATSRN